MITTYYCINSREKNAFYEVDRQSIDQPVMGGKNGHLEGMNTKAARKENCGTSPLAMDDITFCCNTFH